MEPFRRLGVYGDIENKIHKNRGVISLSGCVDSEKVHAAFCLWQGFRCRLFVTYSEQKARELAEDIKFFDRNVLIYPAKDFLFFHADIQGNVLVGQRVKVLKALCEQEEVTIVATFDALMDALRPFGEVREEILTLAPGQIVETEALSIRLTRLGYERTAQAEMPGQFAVRGGIVDIYPLTGENPWRIEFWDDEVDSIRSFDPESQRSIETLDRVTVYPAAEQEVQGGRRGKGEYVSFADYFDPSETLIFIDEPVRSVELGRTVEKEYRELLENRAGLSADGEEQEAAAMSGTGQVLAKLMRMNCVALSMLDQHLGEMDVNARFQLEARSIPSYNNSFETLLKDLKAWKTHKYSVILMCTSGTRAKRLAGELADEGLNSFYSEDAARALKPTEIMVVHGNLHRGYEYPLIRFAVLSETDIFGHEKKKRRKQRAYEGTHISDFAEIHPGDYVVHENHGLGIYRGIEQVRTEGVLKDYIKIEYGDGGNLYIPATQLEAIQKYAGGENANPKLNRLGGTEWTKTRLRVRKAVREIADDLVELYAKRREKNGYVYSQDTVWQAEFEELFPYEETEGQQLAIEAVKRDMESTKIMDRLICGDVGYGKTEIAIRAAFKAVQDNKQVVFLVPTTILAQQHYNTFVQRMKDFPVRVDLLCRFRTPAEQKKTLTDLRKGFVDIVIGTHRVLSDDVVYKDLGLLIIDEEQRFGVNHKEKIKKLKENVDVLSLTATPIPRTLHMSLIGIRDMSVLEEAPRDRLPIQTYVMEYDPEMVRAAIARELGRGGQVYYVYNRVNTIADIAGQISRLVPEANVAFAHGRMKEHELERIMYDFIAGDIDVLISTTIIETGLDIPNVNTLIVQDADNMGLAQLYQLRGRVGRSNRTAYAFLMYRRDKMLKEVAEKRLGAIREYTDLGSGFKIAMRDLEIRGAGSILGEQQSGHIGAVGYDLYCKMLNEAVKESKGESAAADEFQTVVDMDVDAYIPDTYISSENQKLDIYKRVAGIESFDEAVDIEDELIDRYGEPPAPVVNLLKVAELKVKAHQVYVKEIDERPEELCFLLYEKAGLNPAGFQQFLGGFGGRMKFVRGDKPGFFYRRKKGAPGTDAVLDTTDVILERMKTLCIQD